MIKKIQGLSRICGNPEYFAETWKIPKQKKSTI